MPEPIYSGCYTPNLFDFDPSNPPAPPADGESDG